MENKIKRYEDLEVWKESMRLAVKIYKILNDSRDFSLKDQMQRAAISIPSNIAEGYERNTNKDFIRFLHYSKGSCSELRTQIYLAIEVKTIPKSEGQALIKQSNSISAMLHNYIKVRKEKF
ncbi:MAG: four helix bundle protein [Spirochaetaceae bacterium]|jgi:four helix bundle protein|nr:four helix bundle protein [Spirochaetaceae bacterium]